MKTRTGQMKKFPRIHLVAILLAFTGCAAQAQSKVYGNGAASCGLFVAAAEAARQGNPSVDSYMMWFSGYASLASAQTGIDYFAGADVKGQQLWLENYCRAHPLAQFDEAAAQLMGTLTQRQGQ